LPLAQREDVRVVPALRWLDPVRAPWAVVPAPERTDDTVLGAFVLLAAALELEVVSIEELAQTAHGFTVLDPIFRTRSEGARAHLHEVESRARLGLGGLVAEWIEGTPIIVQDDGVATS
jgi:hypothetical protein